MPEESRRRSSVRLVALVGSVGAPVVRYLRDFRFSGAIAGWLLASRTSQAGALGRVGIAMVGGGSALTAFLVSRRAAPLAAQSATIGSETVLAGLVLYAAGSAFAMAASMIAGAIVGYVFAGGRRASVRLAVTLFVALAFAAIAPQLPRGL